MEIINKQGDIFNLENTDFSLIFGEAYSGSIEHYATSAGFPANSFLLRQPLEWQNDNNRHVRFNNIGACTDDELRIIVHSWLKEANDLGKRNLATNGVNNPLQPPSNMRPEFEMRQFERARYIETIILSWCKFNNHGFESITLVSMDPDYLELNNL